MKLLSLKLDNMITVTDKQIKDNTLNVPVTPEILAEYGFIADHDLYGCPQIEIYRKKRKDGFSIVLKEYLAEWNSAIIKPYKRCYSSHISYYDRNINYIIYTVDQLNLFLECFEKVQQIKTQVTTKIDKIEQELTSTLLKNDN